MARDDLDLRIRALVDGVREVQNLTDEIEELQSEAGQQIPDNTTRLRRGLKRTDREAEGLRGQMDKLQGAIGALGAGAVFGTLARQAGRAAIEIERAQRQARTLGTTTADVQRLTFAFRQFGADANDVPDVLGQISDRALSAIEGTESYVQAFRQIGIEVDELRNKEPDELLRLIADGLADTEDPTRRLAIASELLGDEMAARLLPLLSQGSQKLDELGDTADRVGATVGEDTADNIAKMNRELREMREILDATFTQRMGAWAGAIGEAAEALNEFQTGGDRASRIEKLEQVLARRQGVVGMARQGLGQLGETFLPGFPTPSGFGADMTTAQVRAELERLRAQAARERSAASVDPELRALFAGGPPGGDDDASGFEGQPTHAIRVGGRRAMPYLEALEQIEDQTKDVADTTEETGRRGTHAIRLLDRKTLSYLDALEQIESQSEESFNQMSVFANQAARNIQGALADFLFDPFEQGLEGLADQFVVTLRRMAAEAAAAQILQGIFGESGGGGGSANSGFAAFLANLFSNSFAEGGRPQVGRPAIVGERGPEVFVPDHPGTVVPNDEIGGRGAAVVVNQQITTPDAQSFRRSRSAIRRDAQMAMRKG